MNDLAFVAFSFEWGTAAIWPKPTIWETIVFFRYQGKNHDFLNSCAIGSSTKLKLHIYETIKLNTLLHLQYCISVLVAINLTLGNFSFLFYNQWYLAAPVFILSNIRGQRWWRIRRSLVNHTRWSNEKNEHVLYLNLIKANHDIKYHYKIYPNSGRWKNKRTDVYFFQFLTM